MFTKNKKRFVKFLLINMFFGIFLISCGGGGGGAPAPPAINYTGLTTQAQIDQGNAEIMATGAWIAGTQGGNINVIASVQANPEFQRSSFSLGEMFSIFDNVTKKLNIPPLVEQSASAAVKDTNMDPIYGNCGGVVTGSGTADDVTGVINLSVSFQSYCEDGATINGPAYLSGTVDLNTLEPNHFTLSFSSLTMVATDRSITINGTIGVDHNPTTPSLITMTYVMKDNHLNKTYWYRDVIVEYNAGFGLTQIISISGQYYDPDYGYVEMSLGEDIGWIDTEDWPSGGSLILTGTMGTKARLTFLDITSYQVDVDTDGNGAYDNYTSGPKLWSEL